MASNEDDETSVDFSQLLPQVRYSACLHFVLFYIFSFWYFLFNKQIMQVNLYKNDVMHTSFCFCAHLPGRHLELTGNYESFLNKKRTNWWFFGRFGALMLHTAEEKAISDQLRWYLCTNRLHFLISSCSTKSNFSLVKNERYRTGLGSVPQKICSTLRILLRIRNKTIPYPQHCTLN